MLRSAFALCAILSTSAAWADIVAEFDEGAPKDSFSITNSGACPVIATSVLLDLGSSDAGLIFDVTGSGAGVEVFQPLRFVAGQGALEELPQVRDGDSALRLRIARLEPGDAIVFTIDVDDTKGRQAIMISGAEIEGARIVIEGTGAEARFAADARARVPHDACAA